MNFIRIKIADCSDAQIISFLGRATFAENFGDLFSEEELKQYLDETFGIEKLERSLLKKENIFGILFYLDVPVGYYKVKLGIRFDYLNNEQDAQLQKIYVLREYLRLGLGKEMLRNILNLQEIKDRKMIWLVVLHTNYSAIQFYEHQGFEKFKKYHRQIGSRCLEYELMTRPLAKDVNI